MFGDNIFKIELKGAQYTNLQIVLGTIGVSNIPFISNAALLTQPQNRYILFLWQILHCSLLMFTLNIDFETKPLMELKSRFFKYKLHIFWKKFRNIAKTLHLCQTHVLKILYN